MGKALIKTAGRSVIQEAVVDPTDKTISLHGKTSHIDKLPLEVPIHGTVYGTLFNGQGALNTLGDAVYQAPYHAEPTAPVLYIKPGNTLTAHGMPIPVPESETELQMGAALGVVIGRDATKVKEREALDCVAGYTIVNDVSIPHTSFHRPATREKARDGFCPTGPWVIAREAIDDPDHLAVNVYIDGELRQKSSTANHVRSVARLIADVTEFMTLYEGDMLLTGVAAGILLAKAGQRVRVEIDEIGYLENALEPEQTGRQGSRTVGGGDT